MDRFLSRLVDIGLRAVIVVAPLFMGGRHPLGVFAFVALVSLVALVGSIRWAIAFANRTREPMPTVRLGTLEYCFLAGIAFLMLQLAPMLSIVDGSVQLLGGYIPGSEQLTSAVGSQRAFLLSAWDSNAAASSLGNWNTLSLQPHTTRINLILFSAYAVLFCVTSNHLRSVQQVRSLIRFLGFSLAAFAMFGIVQYLFGNGKYFWFYDQPLRGAARFVQGPFTNPNHFAHFIALGIGPLIWLLFASENQPQTASRRQPHRVFSALTKTDWISNASFHTKVAGISCLGLILACGALSLSRGGMLSHGVALCAAAGIALLSSRQVIPALSAIAVAATVATLFIFTNGSEAIERELNTISWNSTEDIGESIGRDIAWDSAIATYEDLPIAGAGAGSYRDIYKSYLTEDAPREYTHGENGYLQILAENGFVGIALLAIALVAIGLHAYQLIRSRFVSFAIAIVPGIAISLLHSLVDFVWFIPACISLTIILVACLRSLCLIDRIRTQSMQGQPVDASRWVLGSGPQLVFVVAVLCVIPFGLRETWKDASANQHWEMYLAEASSKGTLAKSNEPDASRLRVERGIECLQNCLRLQPNHARAHIRLAEMLLHRFRLDQMNNPTGMGLEAYAEAARLSDYQSSAEVQDWMQRGLGDSFFDLRASLFHAHRGVQLCPLQGEGYVFLAQLAFLVPEAKLDTATLLDQAVTVRPCSGEMLVLAASLYEQQGDVAKRDELLATAYRINTTMRRNILNGMAFRMRASEFVDRIKPDRAGLASLVNFHIAKTSMEQAAEAATFYFAAVESDAEQLRRDERGGLMKEAASVARKLGDADLALSYSMEALECTPNDFDLRRSVGQLLLASGDAAAAQEHLRWCVTRRPNDSKVKAALRQAIASTPARYR